MSAAAIFSPFDTYGTGELGINWGAYQHRFLAQGDSWFSIGALNLAKNTNLRFEMEFSNSNGIVN